MSGLTAISLLSEQTTDESITLHRRVEILRLNLPGDARAFPHTATSSVVSARA